MKGSTFVVGGGLIFALITAVTIAADSPMPAKFDRCPVCGMFVAKYPEFAASIQFRDSNTLFFDGVKDLCRYYQHPEQYPPVRSKGAITAINVTDYYTVTSIDGLKAWYVEGSDVYGPMGKEVIPFATERSARQFLRDHHGSSILRFKDLGPEVIKKLE